MADTNYIARNVRPGHWEITKDGFMVGRVQLIAGDHHFFSNDDELQDGVNGRLPMRPYALREVLPMVRIVDTQLTADRKSEHEAEVYAENAWLRAAEYDPQAQDEMYRDDMRAGW